MTYDHIVLISLDTLRSDCIGANPFPLWPRKYGSLRAPATTVLDELASEGAYFLDAISAAPYTAASHGTYFTGRYPLRHGLYEFYNGRLSGPSLFTIGARAGHRTILKTDFSLILGPQLGFTSDIDDYLVEDDQGFVDAVLAAPSSVSCAHFGGIHLPYGFHNLQYGGDAYRRKVAELDATVPRSIPLPVDQLRESLREGEDEELLLRYKRAVHYHYAEGHYELLFGLYLEGVEHFLRNRFEPFLAQLRRRLAAAGKSFLLVVFGDHGHEYDEESCGHFNSLAEGVLRVPVIFVGEGVHPALHRRRVRTADVVPTICELASLPLPSGTPLDGVSLLPALRGAELPDDLPALAQAYTSDAGEFLEFQKQQLAGAAPAPLRHVLVGEAAYAGRLRVVRLRHRYVDGFTRLAPIAPDVRTEQIGDDLVPRPKPNDGAEPLLAMLDEYSSARRPAERVPVPASIREALQRLGYHI